MQPLKKYTKADKQRMKEAYVRKFTEYSQMPLVQLEAMLAAENVKGTYLLALQQAKEHVKSLQITIKHKPK
jgi:nitrate reductase assembly molybdenum cofactor insertion protein NarJ